MKRKRLNRIAFLKKQGWHQLIRGWWVRPDATMYSRMYSLTEAYNTAVRESLRIFAEGALNEE